MLLSFIVAVAENGVIGRDDDLPWQLSDDLRRFRALTTGHHVLMGRKTHASILARLRRPLPDRTSLVVSRDPAAPERFAAGDVHVFSEVDAAIGFAARAHETELFVIGGATLYRALLHRADRIHLTEVHAHIDGDTRLPPFDRSGAPGGFVEVERVEHPADARNEHPFSFVTLTRVVSPNGDDGSRPR